jgi:hypothetical protein
MERHSDHHGPRLDDAMKHEVESLTRGAPVESRVDRGRELEDAGDGEIVPEAVVETVDDPRADMTRDEVRSRSELAQHLRPSVFPAEPAALAECARDEHADPALVARLGALPARPYRTVEEVWEALGGHHEQRVHPPVARAPERFTFRFDRVHRVLAAPFGVTDASAFVEVDRAGRRLVARYGRWYVETDLDNVAAVAVTGPYRAPKTVGPAHLSLVDRGLTFASNDDRGVCIRFREPVRGIEPFGVVRHPALTVTVAEPDALADLLP